MRVLPGEGITAPRLPRLKSHSFRRFGCLSFARLASGNDASAIATWRVDGDESSPERVPPESDEAAFVLGIWILQRQGVWVPERLLRVRKTHAVLAQVRLCLGRVERDLHRYRMHNEYAYGKNDDWWWTTTPVETVVRPGSSP